MAVASIVFLSACQGAVSQKTPDNIPPSNEPTAQQPSQNQSSYEAGAIQAYSPTVYAEALADGKTVIIDFHASWCPTCAANAPGIRAAFESTANPNVVGFIADYDIETALENQFGVSSQSTLVKVRGSDPSSAKKVSTLGPGPLTQQQVETFIQS